MKGIIGVISIVLLSLSLNAQPANRGERQRANQERVHAIKVGYLTDRLKLTSAQAEDFWPVYNQYEAEMREARKAFRKKHQQGAAMESNAEAATFIEDNLDIQEQALEIKRKYKDRLLKVISAQQLATLYEAERDFKKLLLERLQERRGMRRQ
jgi:hypothetical protein